MPEGLEAEIYRRAAAVVVGRVVGSVSIDDHQATAGALPSAVTGCTIVAARRLGKMVLLDTTRGSGGRATAGPTLGLHFGMTGRLIVDGGAPIDRLVYGGSRDDPAWDRLVVRFRGGGTLRVNDPRRWATFTFDPDESVFGPDFLSLTVEDVAARCRRRRAAIKAVLLDQHAIAGFGNLCADEILWHASIAPHRPADSLTRRELVRLVACSREQLPAMLARGGSHTGTIDTDVRRLLPPCPRDGAPLRRDVVATRTTIWCPRHQR